MNRTLVAWRETRAVELALAGLSFDEIAKALGYANRSGPWKAVRRALARRQDRAVHEYRLRELDRLWALQQAAWPDAVDGDLAASARVLRAATSRSRLLDL